MADTTISNEHNNSKHNAILEPTAQTDTPAPARVYVHSLPWSLRHASPRCALDGARDIAAFLREVTTTPRVDDIAIGETTVGDWHMGLSLCFSLLIDKLDIAAGTYKFPSSAHESIAPHLCERIGVSHE